MKRACAGTILAQDAKLPAAHIANIGKGSDNVMGQNSRQPEGLRPKSALTLSAGLSMRPGLGLAQRGAGRGAKRRVDAMASRGFRGCSRKRACG